jgi:transposase-like protein
MIGEAEKCGFGQVGSLLRREGLTYTQLSEWRKASAEGRLTDKRRGPQANPNLAEVRRLEAENARLKRQLEQAEAIIDAQKKLARLLESQKGELS